MPPTGHNNAGLLCGNCPAGGRCQGQSGIAVGRSAPHSGWRADWPWFAAILGFVLTVAAWPAGFQLDDFFQGMILRGDVELGNGNRILDLFTFSKGTPIATAPTWRPGWLRGGPLPATA